MTRIERRLALAERQRRFEWELARDEQVRAAARLVAGRTHALLNLVQIVDLAAYQLEVAIGEQAREIVVDLHRSVEDTRRELRELLVLSRAEVAPPCGDPVAAAITGAIATLREVADLAVALEIEPDRCTRCSARELEHLVIGLVLDAPELAIELAVREREIAGAPWIELVRATSEVPAGDRFELRAVAAIAERRGGELATSERRGGGFEVIVALPVAT